MSPPPTSQILLIVERQADHSILLLSPVISRRTTWDPRGNRQVDGSTWDFDFHLHLRRKTHTPKYKSNLAVNRGCDLAPRHRLLTSSEQAGPGVCHQGTCRMEGGRGGGNVQLGCASL